MSEELIREELPEAVVGRLDPSGVPPQLDPTPRQAGVSPRGVEAVDELCVDPNAGPALWPLPTRELTPLQLSLSGDEAQELPPGESVGALIVSAKESASYAITSNVRNGSALFMP